MEFNYGPAITGRFLCTTLQLADAPGRSTICRPHVGHSMNIPEKTLMHIRKVAIGLVAASIIVLLGLFRISTEAEFALASAAIVPVVLVSWLNGFAWGGVFSMMAALMWVYADYILGREFSSHWIPFANGLTRLATYLFVAYLTASKRALLMKQIEMATHDALTGIPNRRSFVATGQVEIVRALRYQHAVAVIFIDLDNFKQLNDSRGHDAGDAALKSVASALRKSLRETDHFARLGGDEFAVLLPEISEGAASQAGHKISAAIENSVTAFAPASASIGVAWFEKPGPDFSEMLRAADTLMYEIKNEGKHGVRVQAFRAAAPDGAQP